MSLRRIGVFVAIVAALWVGGPARADLLLDHFGVTLQLGTPVAPATTSPFDLTSFTPTKNLATVDYIVGDWYGVWDPNDFNNNTTVWGDLPAGGEPYDVEAIYFDDDPYNLYVAIVTSFDPPPGRNEDRFAFPQLVVTGDLAIDLGLNGPAADGFNYDYGVDINNEVRPTNPALNATAGSPLSFPTPRSLYRTANTDWYLGSPTVAVPAINELSNLDPDFTGSTAVLAGQTIVNYYEYDLNGGTKDENDHATYVVEATIPRAYLGGGLNVGQTVGLSLTEGCRNDVLRFQTLPDVDTEFIPEPTTMALLLTGIGAGLWRKRRQTRKTS